MQQLPLPADNGSLAEPSVVGGFSHDFDSTNGSVGGVERGPLPIVVPITVLYIVTFVVGAVGNSVTCVVIVHNRYMHTATNYYLLSMAVSDLLLLLTGLPFELYSFWRPGREHVFGDTFCVLRGLCAETSTNASILTIVLFTVERYLAICHPLLQHTFSRLSRALRNIAVTWSVALVCALFPALQFGIKLDRDTRGRPLPDSGSCNVVRHLFPHVFELSTVVFFVVPMMLISLLYVRIGLRLRRHVRRRPSPASIHGASGGVMAARRAVIRMLVAVVVAFFICWAPFHAQRVVIIYAPERPSPQLVMGLKCLHYISGVLYFISTCINPILYHTMSAKFRRSLQDTFEGSCCSARCRSEAAGERSDQNVYLTVRVPSVRRSIAAKPVACTAV
ncbi:LOW QUALITY PROTEIN: pyrokinin-1 receptor-like [Pollicipes pollicipes]|uniref:LOW QUALITY PROTEIN: pyrokinin-1 receptor-like n=1 Tax=Pollicipes pollicipes TaxID=41117 RepID=UPI001884C5A1|nr:LOW QUALITY PROTEIN: pyrokinin-1 receptor-like [Pollicipes pollicipes]